MALAALTIVRLIEAPGGRGRMARQGTVAMLLVGIAMQIKYSAVFEGAYFGLALLWIDHRRGAPLGSRVLHAAAWVGVAFVPTLAAWLAYVAIGHGPEFVFANFTSIVARGNPSVDHQLNDLRHILVRLVPFLLPLLFGEWFLRDFRRPASDEPDRVAVHRFVLGWVAAAVAGFAVFGTFFDHYALPLLVPLAIAATPAFTIRYRAAGPILAAVLMLVLFVAYPLNAAKQERKRGDAFYARLLTAEIAPELHGGCLYVFYGEPILYQLTHSCLPSRWSFPFHLSLRREAPALGVDPMAEVKRILAARPPVVVDRLNTDDEVNKPVQAYVRAVLARDYRLAAAHRRRSDVDQVWVRR